jgi:DNA polymerase-3 subunit alpha
MTSSQTSSGIDRAFTHLEVHSHFTLLGATSTVQELVARASAENFTHLALTDSNALYGSVAFHNACLREDIQPILGMTVSVALPPEVRAGSGQRPGHLVLLAKNRAGYRSLCRISSIIQGTPERDVLLSRGIGWSSVAENTDGLFCLSGGHMGWIDRILREGQVEGASRYAALLGGAFGEDAFLSLEIHRPEDKAVAQEIENLGNRFGLKTVAVQPVYYMEPDEWSKVQLLNAIDKNVPLLEIQKSESANDGRRDRHWLGAAEAATRFDPFPDALSRIGEIARQCHPSLPDGRPIWPVLKLPEDKKPDEALAELAWDGLLGKYGPVVPVEVRDRLEGELAAIGQTGFSPLFLIVADIVRFARQTGVPVSTRGSVANSLVAYCTGITTVDPIAHNLFFERFLNPARSSPPDIDLDFCSRRRDEILAYVRQTYGKDQVALVATISTLGPKSAVRETGKALGLDEDEIGRLAKSLPRTWHPDPRRRSSRTVEDLLAELDDPRLEEVITKAYELIGQPHHLSVHPGGVVITPGPLTDFVPVQLAPKGFLITQFDYRDLESLGLPKLDLLGISALTVMADAAELVRRYYDPDFVLEDIPLQDAATGDLLESGESIGVFQCESAGAQRTLRQLKARTVADLAVANAFFKPGPATGGMAQAFIRRYRGEEEVRYLHPALEPILAPTKGVLLFQEQILRVATEIAGLDWQQANQLRRGMSKFRPDEMEALQSRFIAGCEKPSPDGPGFTPAQAETLWDQVRAFAGYGFNQGHATAYADVSYRSAYLKSHWPAAYFCARLADWGGFHHPAIYTAEAIRLGITVHPPHVNHSQKRFTLTFGDQSPSPNPRSLPNGVRPSQVLLAAQSPVPDPQRPTTMANEVRPSPVLWAGLSQIRGLRRKSSQQIIEGRAEGRFNSLEDLLERVSLQTKEVTYLIQCGALDGLGPSRAALLAEAEDVRRAGSTRQMAFTFDDEPGLPAESPADRLNWEQHILGRPISVHPLDLVDAQIGDAVPLRNLADTHGRRVTVAAVRLPGWTGGPGYFLGDQKTFVVARSDESLKSPQAWIPLKLRGRWLGDEWGTHWFQVEELDPIPPCHLD